MLDQLAARHPAAKQRVDDYLAAILPGTLGIDPFTFDLQQTLRLRMADPAAEHGIRVFAAVEQAWQLAEPLTAIFTWRAEATHDFAYGVRLHRAQPAHQLTQLRIPHLHAPCGRRLDQAPSALTPPALPANDRSLHRTRSGSAG